MPLINLINKCFVLKSSTWFRVRIRLTLHILHVSSYALFNDNPSCFQLCSDQESIVTKWIQKRRSMTIIRFWSNPSITTTTQSSSSNTWCKASSKSNSRVTVPNSSSHLISQHILQSSIKIIFKVNCKWPSRILEN